MKFLACIAIVLALGVFCSAAPSRKCAAAYREEERRLEWAQIRCMLVYGFLQENCEYVKKVRAENAAENKRIGCPPPPPPTFPPTQAAVMEMRESADETPLKCTLAYKFEDARLEHAQIRCMLEFGFLQENCKYVKRARANNAALSQKLGCPPEPVPTFPPTDNTPLQGVDLMQNPACVLAHKSEEKLVAAAELYCIAVHSIDPPLKDCGLYVSVMKEVAATNQALRCGPLPHNDS